MKTFYQDLLKAVIEVAEEQPDSTSRFCSYFNEDDGSPNCVVGHALSRIGFTAEDFGVGGLEDMNTASVYGLAVSDSRSVEGFPPKMPATKKAPLSPEWRAMQAVNMIQIQQDHGDRWADAVAEGLKLFGKWYG